MDSEQGGLLSNISIFTAGYYRGLSTRSQMGKGPRMSSFQIGLHYPTREANPVSLVV
jgi:hypothetical protein